MKRTRSTDDEEAGEEAHPDRKRPKAGEAVREPVPERAGRSVIVIANRKLFVAVRSVHTQTDFDDVMEVDVTEEPGETSNNDGEVEIITEPEESSSNNGEAVEIMEESEVPSSNGEHFEISEELEEQPANNLEEVEEVVQKRKYWSRNKRLNGIYRLLDEGSDESLQKVKKKIKRWRSDNYRDAISFE